MTVAQILSHAARLRRAGETRIPLYVMDAGYDEAPVTWELREHLDQVQVLVRVRNDRVTYRDPDPEPRLPGRPRRHGTGRFECEDPGTWGEPDQVMIREDDRYGLMTVMSWGGLHPKLACRGHFETMARLPIITCHLTRKMEISWACGSCPVGTFAASGARRGLFVNLSRPGRDGRRARAGAVIAG